MSRFRNAIKAWHGTAYDFERFEDKAIGSGEGAQVYGHGHYLAENPDVARDYRRTVTQKRLETSARDRHSVFDAPVKTALRIFIAYLTQAEDESDLARLTEAAAQKSSSSISVDLDVIRGNIQARARNFRSWSEKHPTAYEKLGALVKGIGTVSPEAIATEYYLRTLADAKSPGDTLTMALAGASRAYSGESSQPEILEALEEIHQKLSPHVTTKPSVLGRLYELEVQADPDKMLHWDKPLDEQPEIQKAAGLAHEEVHGQPFGNASPTAHVVGEMTGEEFYRELARRVGPAEASNLLKLHGIHGIKYYDQGSRGQPAPVLFVDGEPHDLFGHAWLTWDDAKKDPKTEEEFHLSQLLGVPIRRPVTIEDMHMSAQNLLGKAEKAKKDRDGVKARGVIPSMSDEDMEEHVYAPYRKSYEWFYANKHRLEFRTPPRTHNYVVFDPKLIHHVRKYDEDDKVIHDYTQAHGAQLTPVDHDPFK